MVFMVHVSLFAYIWLEFMVICIGRFASFMDLKGPNFGVFHGSICGC